MRRMPADPVGRLAVLEAARAAVEPKTTFNADEMAKAAGMTWRNLKQIIERDPEFPVLARGDMGVPWKFDAAAVLDHMIGSARSAKAEREARMARVSRLAGLSQSAVAPSPGGSDAAGSGSAADIAQTARAVSALIDAQTKLRVEKRKQGLYVDRAEVQALLDELMSTMQAETLAAASRMDPANQWEPSLRASVEEELRNVLATVRERVDKRLERWHEPRH